MRKVKKEKAHNDIFIWPPPPLHSSAPMFGSEPNIRAKWRMKCHAHFNESTAQLFDYSQYVSLSRPRSIQFNRLSLCVRERTRQRKSSREMSERQRNVFSRLSAKQHKKPRIPDCCAFFIEENSPLSVFSPPRVFRHQHKRTKSIHPREPHS